MVSRACGNPGIRIQNKYFECLKHNLPRFWMLKRTHSQRQFYLTPKLYVLADIKKSYQLRPCDSRLIKRRQYLVSKYG